MMDAGGYQVMTMDEDHVGDSDDAEIDGDDGCWQ